MGHGLADSADSFRLVQLGLVRLYWKVRHDRSHRTDTCVLLEQPSRGVSHGEVPDGNHIGGGVGRGCGWGLPYRDQVCICWFAPLRSITPGTKGVLASML